VANFVSFAQNAEDVMLWRAFQDIENGHYVDIGAGDPERDSVTAAFYERGWRGLNVEANPFLCARLQKQRPEDVTLNVAAGAEAGEVEFFVDENDDRLSTIQAEVAGRHNAAGHPLHPLRIAMRPLRDLCAEHARDTIHFLKIDVEGAEAEVLRGADFKRWRPWLILVEAIDPISLQPNHAAWEGALLDAGYHFLYFDGLNRFYAANERADRLDRHFIMPPNVRDGFVRSAEAVSMNLRQIEAIHASVVADLHTKVYQLRTERDACVASREEMAAMLREGSANPSAHAQTIDRLTAERDGWMQELFESNRHAAYLAQQRQSLLERVDVLQPYAENVEQALARSVAEISRLEERLAVLQPYADNVEQALARSVSEISRLEKLLGDAQLLNVDEAKREGTMRVRDADEQCQLHASQVQGLQAEVQRLSGDLETIQRRQAVVLAQREQQTADEDPSWHTSHAIWPEPELSHCYTLPIKIRVSASLVAATSKLASVPSPMAWPRFCHVALPPVSCPPSQSYGPIRPSRCRTVDLSQFART
jgi:FkbM family methyltransferase